MIGLMKELVEANLEPGGESRFSIADDGRRPIWQGASRTDSSNLGRTDLFEGGILVVLIAGP